MAATPVLPLPAKFLSTLSLRRATLDSTTLEAIETLFLSTLSLRRATILEGVPLRFLDISIHALLAESDGGALAVKCTYVHISIHALLAESDEGQRPE